MRSKVFENNPVENLRPLGAHATITMLDAGGIEIMSDTDLEGLWNGEPNVAARITLGEPTDMKRFGSEMKQFLKHEVQDWKVRGETYHCVQ